MSSLSEPQLVLLAVSSSTGAASPIVVSAPKSRDQLSTALDAPPPSYDQVIHSSSSSSSSSCRPAVHHHVASVHGEPFTEPPPSSSFLMQSSFSQTMSQTIDSCEDDKDYVEVDDDNNDDEEINWKCLRCSCIGSWSQLALRVFGP